MVKPVGESVLDARQSLHRPEPEPARTLFDAALLGATKAKILEATFNLLAKEGYSALSNREIARDAGVNHALINYHFGTKDELVIAVLDTANARLLARQKAMYGAPGSFADKWKQARDFYEGDLASGFVRVQAELMAASFSNPALCAKLLPRILAWRKVVRKAVGDALAELEAQGVKLPPPFTAEVIGCWISEFWLGMEVVDLIGGTAERREHRLALDAMQQLLQAMATGARKPRRRKAAG